MPTWWWILNINLLYIFNIIFSLCRIKDIKRQSTLLDLYCKNDYELIKLKKRVLELENRK